MRSLHKTSCNALVEPWDPIEDRDPCPRPDAGDALAARAWLPRSRRRRAALCVSSSRANPPPAHGGSISAEYFAGSIHDLFPCLCVVYWLAGPGQCGSVAHRAFHGLAFGRRLELRSRCHQPRRRMVSPCVLINRRRRLWRVRRVPLFRTISDGSLTGGSVGNYSACLLRPRHEAFRFTVGDRSAIRPSADSAARIALGCLPMAAEPRERHGCDIRCIDGARHCGRGDRPTGSLARVDRHGCGLVGSREGTFAIFILAALVDPRLGRQRAAIPLFGVHGARCSRRTDPQTLHRRRARGSRRFGNSAHRRSHGPGRDIGAGSSVAMGLDHRFRQRPVAPRHGIASVARRPVRPAVRDIAGIGLDLAGGRWDGMYIARDDIVVDTNKDPRSSRFLFSMGICCAWHRDRGVDID